LLAADFVRKSVLTIGSNIPILFIEDRKEMVETAVIRYRRKRKAVHYNTEDAELGNDSKNFDHQLI
jgi:hypothetical protein